MRANMHLVPIVMLSAIILASPISMASDNIEIRSTIHNLGESMVVWDPSTFAGLFYDINKNIGTETFTLIPSGLSENISTAILSDFPDATGNRGVVYQTVAQGINFKHKAWGQYYIIGFLGDRYFAGYSSQITSAVSAANVTVPALYEKSVNRNLMANEQLSNILIDDDSEKAITSDRPLELEEGYELLLNGMDSDSKGVLLELKKNNQTVDTNIVRISMDKGAVSDQTYYFKKDLGATKGIVIIAVHLKDAVKTDSKVSAIIDGVFQISDRPISIRANQQYDKLRVRTVDPNGMSLTMDNKDNQIVLGRNMDILLIKNFHIRTADQSTISAVSPLRYYIYKEVSCDCQDTTSP